MDCPQYIRRLNRGELAQLSGVCTRTVERLIRRDPTFPKPLRVSRRRLWIEGDVLIWLASRKFA